MGMAQAVREGKWINRPKTGYDLVDGELVAERGRTDRSTGVFVCEARARARETSHAQRASTTRRSSRCCARAIYLGEVLLNGEWFPGRHEPIITATEWAAAHRGRIEGRRRGRDLLSGRVRCGMCQRIMTMEDNGSGHLHYRCRHRGPGLCAPPPLGAGTATGGRARVGAHRTRREAPGGDPPASSPGPAESPPGADAGPVTVRRTHSLCSWTSAESS